MTKSITGVARLLPPVLAMGGIILLSNILVQYPIQYSWQIAGMDINFADLLTWGAVSYPIAFLVTDTTNRLHGADAARKIVYIGFTLGVVLSLLAAVKIANDVAMTENIAVFDALILDDTAFAMLRIAIASGTAFFIGQMLDIAIFNKLRAASWWKAPTISSFFGSAIDTLIFFSLAFAGTGLPWASWAVGDFFAKLVMIAVLLYPFKLLVSFYPRSSKAAS